MGGPVRTEASHYGAPTPVTARADSEAKRAGSGRLRYVPATAHRKPAGMETSAGFSSGNHEKSTPRGSSDRFCPVTGSTPPETTGEKTTSTTAVTRPP